MSFLNIRIPLAATWQSSLQALSALLKKQNIITESTCSWTDFPLIVSATGTMSYSGLSVRLARFLKLGNLAFFRFGFTLTAVAPLSYSFVVDLPFSTSSVSQAPLADQQSGAAIMFNSATAQWEVGTWSIYPDGSNLLYISRPAGANYTANSFYFEFGGFCEVQ